MTDNMWDAVADAWERNTEFADGQLAGATEALLDAAQIGPGDAVLDMAAGPGGAGLVAATRVGETGRVVLSDSSQEMVAAAARRAAGLSNVNAMESDVLAIDAPEGSFDAVICRHGLMFLELPADGVAEAVRVLRPGGRYGAMVWAARADNPWLTLIFDAVGAQFGTSFPPPGIRGPFALDDPELLAAALRTGGLDDVVVTRIETPMRMPSLEAWWERVPQMAGSLAAGLASMEPDVRKEIRERALAAGAAAARTDDAGITLGGAVLVGSGRRSAYAPGE